MPTLEATIGTVDKKEVSLGTIVLRSKPRSDRFNDENEDSEVGSDSCLGCLGALCIGIMGSVVFGAEFFTGARGGRKYPDDTPQNLGTKAGN